MNSLRAHEDEYQGPPVVAAAESLNAARRSRVAAELRLQKTLTDSVLQLYREDLASQSEALAAESKLERLVRLSAAIESYSEFLASTRVVPSNHRSRKSFTRVCLALRGLTYPCGTDVACELQASRSIENRLADLAQAVRSQRGNLQSISAEIAYTRARLDRLKHIDVQDYSLAREIELTELRLDVLRARLRMGRCHQEYEAACIASTSDPVSHDLNGKQLDNAQALVDHLNDTWQRLRDHALASSHSMLRAANGSSARDVRRQIQRLEWQLVHLPNESSDASSVNERRRIDCELDVLRARLAVVLQRALVQQALIAFQPKPSHTFLVAKMDKSHIFEAALTRYLASNTAQDRAAAERRLAQFRIQQLTPLVTEGHASWQELALAEKELAIAEASIVVAQEEAAIAQLQLDILQKARDEVAQHQIDPMAIVGDRTR